VLSGILLFGLVLELIVSTTAFLFIRSSIQSTSGALAIVLLFAIVWRLAIIVTSFLLSGAWRGATTTSVLRAFFGETLVSLYLYSLAQPVFATLNWIRRTLGIAQLRNDATGPVVVLVHGFLCNAGMWGALKRALLTSGISKVYSVTLDPFYTSMPRSLRVFERKLQRILNLSGADQVVLVGHSMGGVLARIFAARRPRYVEGLVCVGAPHAGTALATWVASTRAGPARTDARWLIAFQNWEQDTQVPTLNIWSKTDNIVSPQSSARLHFGAEQILNDVGHLQLVFDRRALTTISTFILDQSNESRIART
jgi:hypothetical protein